MLSSGATRTRETPDEGTLRDDQSSSSSDIGVDIDTRGHGLNLDDRRYGSVARNLDPRKILVHTGFTGEPQHLFTEDVAHDFTRATLDRVRT